jgi:hypothetical protein
MYPDDSDNIRAFHDLYRGQCVAAWRVLLGSMEDGITTTTDVIEMQFALTEDTASEIEVEEVPLMAASIACHVNPPADSRRSDSFGGGQILMHDSMWTNVVTVNIKTVMGPAKVEIRYAPNKLLRRFATLVPNETMELLAFRLFHHLLR